MGVILGILIAVAIGALILLAIVPGSGSSGSGTDVVTPIVIDIPTPADYYPAPYATPTP